MLIKQSLKQYFQPFPLYLFAILPLIIPTISLRIISQYTYIGSLKIVYGTLFGVILAIIAMLVEIVLIKKTFALIQNQPVPKSTWKYAWNKFIPYAVIKIIIAIATLSLPRLLQYIGPKITDSQQIFQIFSIIIIVWVTLSVLIFLFVSYVFLIKETTITQAFKQGVAMFSRKPLYIFIELFINIIIFGIILILAASVVTLIIAIVTKQINLLFNPYLDIWWQNIIIDVFAFFALPFIVIVTTLIYTKLNSSHMIVGTRNQK